MNKSGIKIRSRPGDEAENLDFPGNPPPNERRPKRQKTAALQDAGATDRTRLLPQGFGVRLSSAAFVAGINEFSSSPWPYLNGISKPSVS
jgi:hypothetical protein